MNKLKDIRFIGTAAALCVLASTLSARPAYAGYWSITGKPVGTLTASNGGTVGVATSGPTYTPNSMTYQIGGGGGGSSSTLTGTITYSGVVKWVPSSANDPAPAQVTITEYGYAIGVNEQGGSGARTSANDGLGDPSVTGPEPGFYRGTSQQTVAGSTTSTTHVYKVTVPTGGSFTLTRYLFCTASSPVFRGSVYYKVIVQ